MAALILATLLSGAPMPSTLIDQAALSALVVARGVAGDAPVEPGETFPASPGNLVIWFRHQGLADGAEIRAVWYLMSAEGPVPAGEAATTIRQPGESGHIGLAPASGARWAEGAYRVVLFAEATQLALVQFRIVGAAEAPPQAPTPAAPPPTPAATRPPVPTPPSSPQPVVPPPAPASPARGGFVHPRSGFALTPPTGWTIDDTVSGIDLRMAPARGDGLIDVTSAAASGGGPAAAEAGWTAINVGARKRYRFRMREDAVTIDGTAGIAAVYSDGSTYCKAIFLTNGDRDVVVTAVFGGATFSAGERVFDEVMRTFVWSRD